MSRYAYVNGRYLPFRDAKVHVEDRGYQFADGVYEVCEVRGGRLIDERRHMARLSRSLAELRIAHADVAARARRRVARSGARETASATASSICRSRRGVARRDHAFPAPRTAPSLVVTARRSTSARNEALADKGIAVISVPDNRWGRVDIKTVGLLPNVLARQAALEQGAREAWFVDRDGHVTEGASANAWIVTPRRQAGHAARRSRHPARHHAHRRASTPSRRRGSSRRGARLHPGGGLRRRARRSMTSASQIVMPVVQHRRPCRSATASPGPVARRCGGHFTASPKSA